MAWNPFIGKSQTWLEVELAKAQQDLADGRTVVSAGAGDVNSSSMVHQSPAARIQAILRALNALDPSSYPANAISRDTLVVAQFSDD